MVIQLRGTSGSGKSTIVRDVMRHYPIISPIPEPARRQPIGYLCTDGSILHVVGHYETACGGCDTISSLDEVYRQVAKGAENNCHVLFEGIMASGEYRRCVDLHRRGFPIVVIGLNTPIDECLAAVQARREARGVTAPLSPTRTIRREAEVRRMMRHVEQAGIKTEWHTRQSALTRCLELLQVPHATE